MKSNYVTPTVAMYSYQEDIVTTSGGGTPESTASFKDVWLTD